MTQNDHALALLESGKVLEAIPILRELAWRSPTYKSYINLASALRSAGLFDDSIAYLGRAINIDSDSPHAWLTLANVFHDTGNFTQSLDYYQAALFRSQHGNPHALRQAALGCAQAHLRSHQFEEAWPLWELGRFGESYNALPGTRRWLGEPCKTLLVICEGGFGDAMLFSRWLPFLRDRARHVKLMVWDRMAYAINWQDLGVDEVIPSSTDISVDDIEFTTSWMSLPGIFGMRAIADIPPDMHQIFVAPTIYADEGGMVGYCWRAEENCTIRKVRSLPIETAEALATRLSAHGEVISLCPRAKHLHRSTDEPWPSNVAQYESLLDGWPRTAALVHSCKLVVTVDTAIAHLAGIMCVPTLLLLPCASDWKWGTAANQTEDIWYDPRFLHYYRNYNPWHWDVESIALHAKILVDRLCIIRK